MKIRACLAFGLLALAACGSEEPAPAFEQAPSALLSGEVMAVADNYESWIEDGAPLAAEVDFRGIHTYPAGEEKTIDEAVPYKIENMERVQAALPGKPMAILEAGWATMAVEFGDRASEANQVRYCEELHEWARATNTTLCFFEAFDEPWKGDPNNPLGAKKHWGLFFEDRTPSWS